MASAVSAATRERPHAAAAAASTRSSYVNAPAGVARGAAAGRGPNRAATAVAGALGDLPARACSSSAAVSGSTTTRNTAVVDSFPQPGGHAWTARVDNSDPGAAHGFTVVAVCVPAAAAG